MPLVLENEKYVLRCVNDALPDHHEPEPGKIGATTMCRPLGEGKCLVLPTGSGELQRDEHGQAMRRKEDLCLAVNVCVCTVCGYVEMYAYSEDVPDDDKGMGG